ncbi:hypothetical protein DLJ82_5490 (plasmid) [Rhizobium leguminosarum]|uniref:Uncharacterized protein n=1 Tax=Rhizobium leguminosarum TaxID=384 RepID=A0A2Z4YPB4_RHILE|nr:hypothetical protein DLJ82_5490 [Rhizobium leguminosarum]
MPQTDRSYRNILIRRRVLRQTWVEIDDMIDSSATAMETDKAGGLS